MNRRNFVISGSIVGGAALLHSGASFAKTLDPNSRVSFAVPKGATDCHVHIFDPVRFSYSPNRRYTPPPATVNDLKAFHSTLGIERAVLVQPSVYGTDNSCLLDALSQLGPAAKAVAVIGPKTPQAELADMAGRGVRGVRINLEVGQDRNADSAITKFRQTQEQAAPHGLFIQVYGALPVIAALAPHISNSPVPVLIDHFGLAQAALGTSQEGFEALTGLLKARKAYIKLSGPYQISRLTPTYRDIHPVAAALAAAEPGQAVWGSDWPHTGGANRPKDYKPADIELFRTEDDGRNLSLLKTWAPAAEQRRRILLDNPARLYGF